MCYSAVFPHFHRNTKTGRCQPRSPEGVRKFFYPVFKIKKFSEGLQRSVLVLYWESGKQGTCEAPPQRGGRGGRSAAAAARSVAQTDRLGAAKD